MFVFRIARKTYISDLSGEGARRNGGRWNREKVPVLYTGSNIAVSSNEYLVHLKKKVEFNENNFARITIEVPNGSVLEIKKEDLPGTWPQEGEDLFKITDAWITKGEYLCMKVPSFAVEGEWNYLINPVHPLAKHVKIVEGPVDFHFDPRLFNRELTREDVDQTLDDYFTDGL